MCLKAQSTRPKSTTQLQLALPPKIIGRNYQRKEKMCSEIEHKSQSRETQKTGKPKKKREKLEFCL
jgi:hypothetical protein